MMMQSNISLKPYNTFGVDAETKYFAEIHSTKELIDALREIKKINTEKTLPLLILGGGSNILITKNFEGVTLKLNLKGIKEEILSDNKVLVSAMAGENWHQFVIYCLEKNYGGLENLSLIPGNVGTSPMQNIGAYGTEIKDIFAFCKALNLDTLEIETFSKEECRFGYRESIFKQEKKGKYIIIEVGFLLTTSEHKTQIEYGAIRQELEKNNISNPTIKDVSNAVIAIRKSKLPNPEVLGNAGSFFKNPTISSSVFDNLHQKFSDMPFYPMENGVKIPAGWLIEQCGWKGKQIGNVATHHLQALVIVNATGLATGQEIFDFSTQIINSVKEKFGILLEREVNVI